MIKHPELQAAGRLARLLATSLLLAGTLTACGQKGPLYLPQAASSVITRPAAPTPVTTTPATAESPDTPPVDAPVTPVADEDDKKNGVAAPKK